MGEGSRVLLGDAEERLVAHDSERGDAQVVSLFFAPAPEGVGADARSRGQVAAKIVVGTRGGCPACGMDRTRLDCLCRPADREVWFLASRRSFSRRASNTLRSALSSASGFGDTSGGSRNRVRGRIVTALCCASTLSAVSMAMPFVPN